MFKRIFSAALVFGAAALAPPMAMAALHCAPRVKVVEMLAHQYKEALTGAGLQSPTQLLEVWSSDVTGTFTVLITRPDGIACIMASGQNWNHASPRAPDGVAG